MDTNETPGTALAETQTSKLATPEQAIGRLKQMARDDAIYHYEGKPQLTEKATIELGNRLGIESSHVETEQDEFYWHATAKAVWGETSRIAGASQSKR